jgi:hypothetical protein
MAVDIDILFPNLKSEVEAYLSKKIHIGYSRPFGGVGRFETHATTPGILQVIPKGLEEEDLSEIDENFNRGLLEIGNKYNLVLTLPYWAYEK